MDTSSRLQESIKGLFPEVLGVDFVEASAEGVKAEMLVRDDLCTTPGVLHGGVLMAFADTLGAYGTFLNLPEGAGTTTIESKTNFLARATSGSKLVGESTPVHRGKRTMVFQTRITREDGTLVGVVTQTQIVLPKAASPQEQLAALFQKGAAVDQQALLAGLERAGGALYRRWAEDEADADVRATLLAAADREDENALVLERIVEARRG